MFVTKRPFTRQDMGLGKTVQTIAMILKRPRTKAEEKLGFEKTTL